MNERELERLAGGEGVSIALLVDLCIELARGNRFCRRDEIRWEGIPNDRPRLDDRAIVCAPASIGGYAISRLVGARFMAPVDGFAAGALLVMLSAR